MAWKCLKEFMSETLNIDGVPGSIQSIETNGQFLDVNPHVHTLVTDGVFDSTGTFHQMPRYNFGANKYLKSLWEKAVARYCVDEGFVNESMMRKVLSWDYTGFSVYTDTRIKYDREDKVSRNALGHMIRYITKAPVAKDNVTYSGKKVIYKGSYHPGVKQNFKIYEPLDFIAALTSHIPKKRQKYINYYGEYSSRTRGYRKKQSGENQEVDGETTPVATSDQRNYKRTWAMLIAKVWEVDPLKCPDCSSQMKVVSVIEDDVVIEKILRHLELWEEQTNRGPPKPEYQEIEHIPNCDDWSLEFCE